MHIRNIGLVVAMMALVAWRLRAEPARATGFGAGLAAMIAIKVALNLQFWGTAFTTPHAHLGAWPGVIAFVSSVTTSALGLLFDPRHGLLMTAPVYLLAPAALWLLVRRSRTAATELLVLIAGYVIFVINPVTNVHGWRGGWSPAARFLVPIAPFLALAIPLLLGTRRGWSTVAACIAGQLAIDLYFWGHPMTMWSEGPGPAPLLQTALGASLAERVPVWEHLTGIVLATSLACLAVWALLTRALVGARTNPPA
jgi:hypothetical protein